MGTSLTNDERLNLIEIQMELECVRIEDGNIMVPFDCPNPDTPPRVLVAEIGDEYRVFSRSDLEIEQRTVIEALTAKEGFFAEYSLLGNLDVPGDVWRNRAYVLTGTASPESHDRVVRIPDSNDLGLPIFAIVENGEVLASCSSSRENARSGEAWVFTEEHHRGRGLAVLVVSAWAHDLQQQGKIAFYSHLLENTASRSVARKLDATHFVSEVGYS